MTASAFYRLAGKQIKELVKPYGFKKNGRFFYRITEDGVVQQFCMLWLYRSFTLRYYLSSVYGYNGLDIEGDEIHGIINGSINQWISDDCTGYDACADNAMDFATAICLKNVQDVLIPFFETHKDPKSAREHIAAHNPRITGGFDKYDLRELGFYLSLGNMEACQDFLVHYIKNSDKYNPNWWRKTEQEYHCLLDAICTNDTAYLSTYMDNKKRATFAEYKWKA